MFLKNLIQPTLDVEETFFETQIFGPPKEKDKKTVLEFR